MDQITSKGLDALKHLYAKLSAKSSIDDISENLQEYEIVEKELKEYESYRGFLDNVEKGIVTYTPRDTWEEERKKLKRLEELEKAFDALSKENEKTKKFLSKEIEKNRALEIIKDRVIVKDKGGYIQVVCEFSIPSKSKKYDLLKEVLK